MSRTRNLLIACTALAISFGAVVAPATAKPMMHHKQTMMHQKKKMMMHHKKKMMMHHNRRMMHRM